jgi:hypothetical protein
MRSDLAVGLFSAYGAILAIIVVYQTLMLQNRLGDAERLRTRRELHNVAEELRADDRSRRIILARTTLENALIVSAFVLIAVRAYSLSMLVDSSELRGDWISYPVEILGTLFGLISVAYVAAIVRRLQFTRE